MKSLVKLLNESRSIDVKEVMKYFVKTFKDLFSSVVDVNDPKLVEIFNAPDKSVWMYDIKTDIIDLMGDSSSENFKKLKEDSRKIESVIVPLYRKLIHQLESKYNIDSKMELGFNTKTDFLRLQIYFNDDIKNWESEVESEKDHKIHKKIIHLDIVMPSIYGVGELPRLRLSIYPYKDILKY